VSTDIDGLDRGSVLYDGFEGEDREHEFVGEGVEEGCRINSGLEDGGAFTQLFFKKCHFVRICEEDGFEAPIGGESHDLRVCQGDAAGVCPPAADFAGSRLELLPREYRILEYLMQNDIQLLICLSVSALFLVIMSWLDEGIERALAAREPRPPRSPADGIVGGVAGATRTGGWSSM